MADPAMPSLAANRQGLALSEFSMGKGMRTELEQALSSLLLAMADDELVIAHRDSEWTGHAPILEEDIAFSNIAQDELGHAWLWYSVLEELTGQDPDKVVYLREAEAYRNVQLVELPKGDWAFSIVRQYLFDAYEKVRASAYASSSFRPLREVIAKVSREELYHYRHTSSWLLRLGLGTEESNRHSQRALDVIWPFVAQLFIALPGEHLLVEEGIVPEREDLRQAWEELVMPFFARSGLAIPVDTPSMLAPRTEHTEHLARLLLELQEVARLDPEAEW